MTNLPPPDPRSSQRDPLGFDDFIGIFVALSAIGAILFWLLAHRHEGLNLGFLPASPSPSPQATATPPTATANPTPVSPTPTPPETSVSPTPTTVPTQSPQVLVPLPLPTRRATPTQPAPPKTVPAPVPVPAPAKSVNFVDVPPGFWARPFINALAARGIVSGFTDNFFRPDQPVTRAEFAAILQAAFDKNRVGQRVSEFKDLPTDFWAAPAIDRTTNDQFLKGYPGDVFRPTQEIPRVQVLVALATGLHLPTPPDPAKIVQIYQDATQIPNYATNQVAAATQAKMVVNYPTQNLLNPNQNATRAEVAAIVYQALVQAGKVQPIQSQYIVQPPQ